MKQDFPGRAGSIRWLLHNTITHPICGCLWFVGLYRAGDWLHETDHRCEGFHQAWWRKMGGA